MTPEFLAGVVFAGMLVGKMIEPLIGAAARKLFSGYDRRANDGDRDLLVTLSARVGALEKQREEDREWKDRVFRKLDSIAERLARMEGPR